MSRVDPFTDKRQVGFAIVTFEFMDSVRFVLDPLKHTYFIIW